ncbi:hypothetical protein Sjap_005576 [Stephania japonica]|uniref:Uncharacterized protein n=1 Tax=Stephania japonica TaxID=461633 RepID=A0AAP0PI41_9MAGN
MSQFIEKLLSEAKTLCTKCVKFGNGYGGSVNSSSRSAEEQEHRKGWCGGLAAMMG